MIPSCRLGGLAFSVPYVGAGRYTMVWVHQSIQLMSPPTGPPCPDAPMEPGKNCNGCIHTIWILGRAGGDLFSKHHLSTHYAFFHLLDNHSFHLALISPSRHSFLLTCCSVPVIDIYLLHYFLPCTLVNYSFPLFAFSALLPTPIILTHYALQVLHNNFLSDFFPRSLDSYSFLLASLFKLSTTIFLFSAFPGNYSSLLAALFTFSPDIFLVFAFSPLSTTVPSFHLLFPPSQ